MFIIFVVVFSIHLYRCIAPLIQRPPERSVRSQVYSFSPCVCGSPDHLNCFYPCNTKLPKRSLPVYKWWRSYNLLAVYTVIHRMCLNKVKCRDWMISMSAGWLVLHCNVELNKLQKAYHGNVLKTSRLLHWQHGFWVTNKTTEGLTQVQDLAKAVWHLTYAIHREWNTSIDTSYCGSQSPSLS